MNQHLISVNDLENEALSRLSNYGGEENYPGDMNYAEENYPGDMNYAEESYEGEHYEGEPYTGLEDPHLDFGGPSTSFANETKGGRIFTMSLINTDKDVDKVIILNPGYFTDVADITGADLIVADGTVAAVTISGLPKRVKEFLAFIKQNPIRVSAVKFKASSTDQLETIMVKKDLSPFRELESKNYYLSMYQDENTFQDKVVTVPTPDLQLDNQSLLQITLLKGQSLKISFICGAINNTSLALKNKATKAIGNLSRLRSMPRMARPRMVRATPRRKFQ